MRNLGWICWYLWEGLPTLFAFPINSTEPLGTKESWSTYWEHKWRRYVVGTLGFIVVVLTLAGCLCCRRQRRPKGFEDDAGNGKEFKDGSTAGTETSVERLPSASLELGVARIPTSQSATSKVQFEALPVERLVGEIRVPGKPKPPSPSLFSEDRETDRSNFLREQPCREWFDAGNRHVPRERLKYLREIGRGWFGKVVEGTTETPLDASKKNRGVVVKILTEEATTREKAWFLGEATPYFKLDDPNVLKLLGSCLETDPYLLLFESCPAGDLKGFLRGNRDKGTCEALRKENVPERMARDIANALEHMHENGFAHTDLSARNCLVAPDLSIKLGDYGTGVEKYPGDYYVVGDRALPIRWSAPESLECTETTIETRAITPRANLWSYAIVLWEIATWGERPYDELGDEQVIEMIFSLKSGFVGRENSDALTKRLTNEFGVSKNFREAVEASWKFFPDERASLKLSKEIIGGKSIEDFEKRWENLKPNGINSGRERDNRSASLQDLRGSVDSELWQSSSCEKKNPLQAQFRLGPGEPVKNPSSAPNSYFQESGSETEEESWRGRVERGAYTEKVKQKSKSVADLMVLVHIDSDSDAEISLGPQIIEKIPKKRLPASGSDGDLRSHVLADEFDEAIRKLREPSICNGASVKITKNLFETPEIVDNIEKPKLLTLTHQGQTPILRLSFGTPENVRTSVSDVENSLNRTARTNTRENAISESASVNKASEGTNIVSLKNDSPEITSKKNNSSRDGKISMETARIEGPVLRLVSKGDPELPMLRYVPERTSTPEEVHRKIAEPSRLESSHVFEGWDSGVAYFSNDFHADAGFPDLREPENNAVDVELWNNALAYELEKKNPGFDAHATIFDVSLDFARENMDESPKRSSSEPNTSKFSNFSMTEIAKKDFSSSAPESPRKNDFPPTIDSRSSVDANYYRDVPVGSCSAPETPQKYCFTPEIVEDSTKSVNYYRDSASSVSAPETPRYRGNYDVGHLDEDSSTCEEASERMLKGSAPDTPLSRGNYSVGNGDEDSYTGEELETGDRTNKRSSHDVDDEEDRKHLSTPDDERSSDSGFRDKESCEEEESPVPCPSVSSIILSAAITSSVNIADSSPLTASAEDEQMRILLELDTILDAEYYGSFNDSEKLDENELLSPTSLQTRVVDGESTIGKNRSISESLESTESTDVVETVRANSCEPDFLDSRSSRDVGPLASPEDEERLGDGELEKLGDFFKRDGEDDKNLTIETSDDTEADFFGDSNSESLKTEKNSSEFSHDILTDARKNSDDISIRMDSRSNDSSAELRRLNVETSSSGKFDISNESTDFSFELRSSDASELNRSKTTDSTSDSPLTTDRLAGNDPSLDIRRNSGSEIRRDTNDSTSRSPRKTENSKSIDASMELENFPNDSSTTSEKRNPNSEILEASAVTKNSANDSPLRSDKRDDVTEIREDSSMIENSAGDSLLNSERINEISEICEKSIDATSQSPRKSERTSESPQARELSTALENSLDDSSPRTDNPNEISATIVITTELTHSANDSPTNDKKSGEISENCEISPEMENSTTSSSRKNDRSNVNSEIREVSETEMENSTSDSPLKTDRNQTSDVSMETRGPESGHSDVENWSSRENINEPDNDDEDSSTMSLRSDNSYVSFGLDEEFVTAIRNELREKLPRAQMPVVESLDPRDEKEPSINKDVTGKRWEDEETEEIGERGTGSVDISIRYNIYGAPLSPILEERESAGTSESMVSKEDSRDDASIASRVSALSEDVLVVDTRTNRAMMLEGNVVATGAASNSQHDEDRDTSHGDFSDDENLEYPHNNVNRSTETKRICMGSGGAPLPSPEEETKWQQQFPLPLQLQDDLMSTSFGTDRDWDSQDEDEGEDDGEDGEDDEEENSSSSGEFVWKCYDESHGDLENVATRSPPNKPKTHEPEPDLDEEDEGDEDDDEEEEEFTPSAWDATLAPRRSALRSPEKNPKSGDQKKSVWFKKQRYHCVYEYPKENPIAEGHGQAGTTWEPTSYADWEEMMDEPRLDVYPMNYDDTNRPGDEEFYVSSSNRPFQFQSGEGKYVSQFFPGASSTLLQHQPATAASENTRDEVDRGEGPRSTHPTRTNGNSRIPDVLGTQQQHQQQQQLQLQLGELRHTRDRLKLNLLSTNGTGKPDGDVVGNRAAETDDTEDSPEKTIKIIAETAKPSFESEKKEFENEMKEKSNETEIASEKEDPIETEAVEIARSATSSNARDSAVKEASDVEMTGERDEGTSVETSESVVEKKMDEGADEPSRIDDSSAIRDDDEDFSAKENVRTIGDREKSSESKEAVTGETMVERIVDIPKLETEESPESATISEENDRRAADVVEATKIEGASVQNAVVNSATGEPSTEAIKVNEIASNVVQSLES